MDSRLLGNDGGGGNGLPVSVGNDGVGRVGNDGERIVDGFPVGGGEGGGEKGG